MNDSFLIISLQSMFLPKLLIVIELLNSPVQYIYIVLHHFDILSSAIVNSEALISSLVNS